jgi:hypothetical protein
MQLFIEFTTDFYNPLINSKIKVIESFIRDNFTVYQSSNTMLYNGLKSYSWTLNDSKMISDLKSLISEVYYPSLVYSVKISGNEDSEVLMRLVELFKYCVSEFFRVSISKVETVLREVENELFLCLSPITSQMTRLISSTNQIVSFLSLYSEILIPGHVFVSNDEMCDYVNMLLSRKGFDFKYSTIGAIRYSKLNNDLEYFNLYTEKMDFLIKMLKTQKYISLNDFKYDENLSLYYEVALAFGFKFIESVEKVSLLENINDDTSISPTDYLVFQIPDESFITFNVCVKQWMINSVYEIRRNELPLYTFYFRIQQGNESTNYVKAKVLTAAVKSLEKMNYPIRLDKIVINNDLSITLPVMSWTTISNFKEYFKKTIIGIENWNSILCPSLGIGIAMRQSIKQHESMIVQINTSDYLVILTDTPTKFSFDKLKPITPKNVLAQRGIKLEEEINVGLPKATMSYNDNCDTYDILSGSQLIYSVDNKKEAQEKLKEWNKGIKNKWIQGMYLNFGIISKATFFVAA